MIDFHDLTFKLVIKKRSNIYGTGDQCHSNHSPQLFELKIKQNKQTNKTKQNQLCYFNIFFVIFFSQVVSVMHNTFTQLDISTQDLLSWLV